MVNYNKIYLLLNKYRRYIPIGIDTCIAMATYLLVSIIFSTEKGQLINFIQPFFLYVIMYIGVLFIVGIYKNMWRYTELFDLYRCVIASIIANLLFCIIANIFGLQVKWNTNLILGVTSTLLSVMARIVFKVALLIINNRHKDMSVNEDINVMLIGAGNASSIIINEIKSNPNNNYDVVCIVDDDKTKIGRRIHSVPIVGDTTSIKDIVVKYKIKHIFLSIPSIDANNKKRILNICSETKCKLKILPKIYSLIDIKSKQKLLDSLRDVKVEDLLGREQITMDCQLTEKYIKDKVVLVTGGGGSIGSELCRQVASYSPEKLIILDIYENNAYEIQQELVRKYKKNLNLEVQIASVRDKNKLEQLFSSKKIDVVFHAAAHKHVPLMESNPEEAVKNNVIGTYNTVCMADKYNVEKFVLISTDKAVNPTNIMGTTKRICEMIVQVFDKKSKTEFVAVRFGNVLGSNGSVIPQFMQQISEGGPVTVTHENITRYFMTIPEAVQLVLKAAVIAKGGEIFVLDMGEPVKIKDLAEQLIRLMGFTPNVDMKIKYTGLRPGEKLYEELLITSDNNQRKTEIDKIFIEQSLNIDEENLIKSIEKLYKAALEKDFDNIIKIINCLVPEYKRTPNNKKDNINSEDIRNSKKNSNNEKSEIINGFVKVEAL